MTLRLEAVLPDLRAVVAGFARGVETSNAALEAAARTLGAWADDASGDERISAAMGDNARPFALSCGEPVAATFSAAVLKPLTVCSADGSSIAPDRFAPVPAYVINTGMVSLPYGVPGPVVLRSEVEVGPRELIIAAEDDGSEVTEARGLGIELLRDVLELERGEDLAAGALEFGEVVLLLDGTLLPWDLDARHISELVKQDALRRTSGVLSRLRDRGASLSMGAYISASRSADVMTSLAALARGKAAAPVRSDGALFRTLLKDGERSALFLAQSRRSERVENLLAAHEVVFFYVRVGDDLARIELPRWAASAEQVARLHAAITDQCRRCGGYPRALQEAHELAVINGADRAAFARLLERIAGESGIRAFSAGKSESKRRRAV